MCCCSAALLLFWLLHCEQLSAVQFHLITTSILFLSREGFRRGGLRIQEEQSSKVTRQQQQQQCGLPADGCSSGLAECMSSSSSCCTACLKLAAAAVSTGSRGYALQHCTAADSLPETAVAA